MPVLEVHAAYKVPARYDEEIVIITKIAYVKKASIASTYASRTMIWSGPIIGAFLVYTGIKILFQKETEVHPDKNFMLRLVRRFVPVTREYHGTHFLIREAGRLYATPLLLVLLVVETTDVVFAVDSIPAIFGITRDPFIVYTSNIFAILGLRSLFFLLAGMMDRFHYLPVGLGLVLAFVGVKMVIGSHYPIPIGWSLGVVAVLLAGSAMVSLIFPAKKRSAGP